jgi:hypothetical protein
MMQRKSDLKMFSHMPLKQNNRFNQVLRQQPRVK